MVEGNGAMNDLYMIYQIEKTLLATLSTDIIEIVPVPQHIDSIPSAPKHLRGVFNHRGNIVSVYDARVLMGYPSYQQELDTLIATLRQREQDHRKWLAELEKSVLEHRPFTLQRDPHKCAFGKWYDINRHTISDNIEIRLLLGQFDEPHQRIHAVADEIERHVKADDHTKAQRILERTKKGELTYLLNLFDELYKVTALKFTEHEIGLIHGLSEQNIMLTADKVIGVDQLHDIEPLPTRTSAPIKALAKDTNNRIVQIVDSDRISKVSATCS